MGNLGLYRDCGIYNGNYYSILGNTGKQNGNYFCLLGSCREEWNINPKP